MSFCNNCGRRVEPGGSRCATCGQVVGPIDRDATARSAVVVETAAAPTGATNSPITTLVLTVLRGPNAGSRFAVTESMTRLGRHPNDTILLDDISVSRGHAEVLRVGDRWRVRDLGSLNGTYLNRKRVASAELRDGDTLQIGMFVLHCALPR